MMRVVLALTCGVFCLAPGGVNGGAMAPPPPFSWELAAAEAVLVGKVTAIEEKTVKAPRWPGTQEKVEYRVAVVKVEEPLLGAKGTTEVKVGLAPPFSFRGSGGLLRTVPAANLAVGQQALVVLSRHHSEGFLVMPNAWDVVDAKARDYPQKVGLARRAAKFLADPAAGLKAKEGSDRLLTATLLVLRYLTPRPDHRQEPIPEAESKAILEALAEADWTGDRITGESPPLTVFNRLGLTEADGWKPPADFRDLTPAAKKWLRENARKYRLKRYVPAQADKGRPG
jgi:hypothetical protein